MHLIKDENGNLIQHGHEHTHQHTHADGVSHTHAHTHDGSESHDHTHNEGQNWQYRLRRLSGRGLQE